MELYTHQLKMHIKRGKLINKKDREVFIDITPGKAKRLWRNYQTYNLTEEFRLNLMYQLLSIKFNQEPFKSLLCATGDCYIQENNNWNDTFWGCTVINWYWQKYVRTSYYAN